MIIDCNEMIPDRLWVGSCVHEQEVGLLKRMGITTVVSLQSDEDLADHGIAIKKLRKAYAAADIELRQAAVNDFDKEDLTAKLPKCIEELAAALAPRWARVYLHCTAGINRSPTVAAAYLIHSRGMSSQEAFDYVVDRRYCKPSREVLLEYETTLKGAS